MPTTNAKNGSAIESRAAQEPTSRDSAHRSTPDLFQDEDILLAQIPDLDSKPTPKVLEKLNGRIISQSLSIKLVFGVGLGLVVGAILPFVFGKASRPNPAVAELPAWSGSAATARDTTQATAPTWSAPPTAPATGAAPLPTVSAPAILSPQPPQVSDTRPTALTNPAWSQPRPSVTLMPAITPPPSNMNSPVSAYPPDNRADNRGFDRPVDPRNLQADQRNNPAAQDRNYDTRYDYRGNPIETASPRRDVPPTGYPRDTRYDNGSSPYPTASGSGSPLMPSGAPGPTSTYRDPQISEPGVARFEGTISTPPVRTSYDRTGSSNN
ncbi:MAG: hypothetical protein WCJ35_06945 [Planctomycetota bacterium]